MGRIEESKRIEIETIVRNLLRKHEWNNVQQFFEEYVSEYDQQAKEIKRLHEALEHICEVEMDSAEFERELMFNIARDALRRVNDIDEVEFVKEPEKEKCYLCRERDAVGKFLNEPCCRECVQSISFS